MNLMAEAQRSYPGSAEEIKLNDRTFQEYSGQCKELTKKIKAIKIHPYWTDPKVDRPAEWDASDEETHDVISIYDDSDSDDSVELVVEVNVAARSRSLRGLDDGRDDPNDPDWDPRMGS